MARVIVVVDESSAMSAPLVTASSTDHTTSTNSVGDRVATVINSWIARSADFSLCVLGCRAIDGKAPDIGPRLLGDFAGESFVKTAELRPNPPIVEQRSRSLQGAGPSVVDFGVWYRSDPAGRLPLLAGWGEVLRLVEAECDGDEPVVAVCVTVGASSDGNPVRVMEECDGAHPAIDLVSCHLSPNSTAPETLFPGGPANLHGAVREAFSRSRVLSDGFAESLRGVGFTIAGAPRGLMYNASMKSLRALLNGVSSHVGESALPAAAVAQQVSGGERAIPPTTTTASQTLPAIEAAATPAVGSTITNHASEVPQAVWSATEQEPCLIACLVDRCVDDPWSLDGCKDFNELQDRLWDFVNKLVVVGCDAVDVAIVSYGADSSGKTDIRECLSGGLSGRAFARDSELEAGALRVEESVEEVYDGNGGILQRHRRRPVLVELEAAAYTDPVGAFEATSKLVGEWRQHSGGPAVVVHFSCASQRRQYAETARDVGADRLYTVVVAGSTDESIACPSAESDLVDPRWRNAFESCSALAGADDIAEDIPTVDEASRGLFVNAPLSLLIRSVRHAVENE